MASDEKLPPRGSGDRIEWFTVSYRTLALAGGAIVLLGALGWYVFGPKEPPPPPPATSVEVGARFATFDGSVHVKAAGEITAEVFSVVGDGSPKRLLDQFTLHME